MAKTTPNKSPRVALVTGASRRIGRSIAEALADDGWTVAVHYRSSAREADDVVAGIERRGGRAAAFGCDLSDPAAVADLVPQVCRVLGAPSCLVNNASEFRLDTVASMTTEIWNLHLDVNLRTPVFLAKAMAEQLGEGRSGNVINIIDQRVWNLSPEFFSYTISKSGLWTATRTLAQALAPHVRVNAIGPGPVLRSVHQADEEFAEECRATLLKRGAAPDEIAAAVRFILAAPAMTGQMIALDGGQHLT